LRPLRIDHEQVEAREQRGAVEPKKPSPPLLTVYAEKARLDRDASMEVDHLSGRPSPHMSAPLENYKIPSVINFASEPLVP